MESARWLKLRAWFAEAYEAKDAAREEILAAQFAEDPALHQEVVALLAAAAVAGPLDTSATQLPPVSTLWPAQKPDRIGPYRVVRELGRGGMGVVYLAERADGHFDQLVAIKLIAGSHGDPALQQRILVERQILAGLVHPNITRLLDGGVADDGRAYLVLEHIDGVPITEYCEQHDLGIKDRLALFKEVAAAVQCAHQNLVIHRDLKPSNILVSTDGRVHLLDFGIAKLINRPVGAAQVTGPELRVLTPDYASPEQVQGRELTTASDVYSLGVLLYELLARAAPYRLTGQSALEIARVVCERDPELPSRAPGVSPELSRQLRTDLDSIVMMALRKEPQRRYATVDMMREDVDRYLKGLPVAAHTGSQYYRLSRFARRHRVEAMAAIVVMISLLGGLIGAVSQTRRASRERDRAEHALSLSTGVSDFLMELFRTNADGGVLPPNAPALELLKRGSARVDELADQPLVQARLLDVIGQLSLNLGRYDDARRLLERSVQLHRTTPGAEQTGLANSLIHLGWVHRSRGHHDTARTLVSEALQIRQRILPAHHVDIADALDELGWLASSTEQEQLYRQALAVLDRGSGPVQRRIALLQSLSTNLRRQGRFTEAVSVNREAVGHALRELGPAHPETGYAFIHLADQVRDLEGNIAEAERLYHDGLALIERAYGNQSVRLLHGLHSLGSMQSQRGEKKAELLFRRALEIRIDATGALHPAVADEQQRLAAELSRQGRHAEAEALIRSAIDLSVRTLGAQHPVLVRARLPMLAEVLHAQGRHEEAVRIFRDALSQMDKSGVAVGEARRNFGRMLIRQRDYPAAQEQLLESLAVLEQIYRGPEHGNVQETRRALMTLYEAWGKAALVEQYRVPPGRYVPY